MTSFRVTIMIDQLLTGFIGLEFALPHKCLPNLPLAISVFLRK